MYSAQPQSWGDLPDGEATALAIQGYINEWASHFYGDNLLKVGALSCAISLAEVPIRHHSSLCSSPHPLGGLQGFESQLPIQTAVIDLCLLAHTLNFYPNHHQILREVERILAPDGWLILTGYNPYSRLGLAKCVFGQMGRYWRNIPMFPLTQICDWLTLLGFEILCCQRFNGRSVLCDTSLSGDLPLALLAKNYLLIARKRRLIPWRENPNRERFWSPLNPIATRISTPQASELVSVSNDPENAAR